MEEIWWNLWHERRIRLGTWLGCYPEPGRHLTQKTDSTFLKIQGGSCCGFAPPAELSASVGGEQVWTRVYDMDRFADTCVTWEIKDCLNTQTPDRQTRKLYSEGVSISHVSQRPCLTHMYDTGVQALHWNIRQIHETGRFDTAADSAEVDTCIIEGVVTSITNLWIILGYQGMDTCVIVAGVYRCDWRKYRRLFDAGVAMYDWGRCKYVWLRQVYTRVWNRY